MGFWEILLVPLWFVPGFITMLTVWFHDMRNHEFDENYFNIEGITFSLFILMFGNIFMFVSIISYWYEQKPFTKLIYKIANIGSNNNL